MNLNKFLVLSFLGCQLGSASIGLEMYIGNATDSSGVAVPDGTLWALVVDDGDLSFPGSFGLNSSISAAGAAGAFLPGLEFELNSRFGADTVFAIGGFNGSAKSGVAGYHSDLLDLTLSDSLVAGRNSAVYFFPGVSYTTQTATYAIRSQVGGLNSPADTTGGVEGMVIPPDSQTVKYGALSPDNLGITSDANFRAVNLVPEPSTALLGLLGVLGLLRRKRN
jgi:hypothetical protein